MTFITLNDLAQVAANQGFAPLPSAPPPPGADPAVIAKILELLGPMSTIGPQPQGSAPINGGGCMGPASAPSIPGFWKDGSCVLACPRGQVMTTTGRAGLPDGRHVALRGCVAAQSSTAQPPGVDPAVSAKIQASTSPQADESPAVWIAAGVVVLGGVAAWLWWKS